MQNDTINCWTPDIIVSDVDRERLSNLATAAMGRFPDISLELLDEVERATVVPIATFPKNVVRMGSTVAFKSTDGALRRVILVFPGEADIAQSKISILTPVGTALIGLCEGQSIAWITRDGREQVLTVLSVETTVASE